MTEENTELKNIYDLQERTTKFSIQIIGLCKRASKDIVSRPIISQLIRAATSIGANYCEADCAESRKDFEHKIGICKKESKETLYWLRMLAEVLPETEYEARNLYQEARELHFIFIAIVKKSRQNGVPLDIRN